MRSNNTYFGRRSDLDEITEKRNAEIRAWGQQVLADADALLADQEGWSDWDVLEDEDEDPEPEVEKPVEEPIQEPITAADEPKDETISDAPVEPVVETKGRKVTSKGSTAEK